MIVRLILEFIFNLGRRLLLSMKETVLLFLYIFVIIAGIGALDIALIITEFQTELLGLTFIDLIVLIGILYFPYLGEEKDYWYLSPWREYQIGGENILFIDPPKNLKELFVYQWQITLLRWKDFFSYLGKEVFFYC